MKLVGRMLSSILCVILLLNSVGCTGTEGSFYPMVNGYAVCRVSNLDVPLIYNENWEDEANEVWGGVIVLHDYYVKGFRYNEEYVAVSGIYAQDCEATEEELNTSPVVYYLINTITHEKFGPFESAESLNLVCKKLKTGVLCDWIIVDPDRPLRQGTELYPEAE